MSRTTWILLGAAVMVAIFTLFPPVLSAVRIVLALAVWVIAIAWPFGLLLVVPNNLNTQGGVQGAAAMMLAIIAWLPGLALASWIVNWVWPPFGF